VRSTTFVFKVLGTFIQNFGVNCVQPGDQQNQNWSASPCAATSRRDVAPVPRRPRHAQPEVPPTEAAASLGTRAPTCLVFSRVRVASPLHRTRAVHRVDHRSDPRTAVRASIETPSYHDGIFVVITLVTPPSSPVDRLAYKRRQGLPTGGTEPPAAITALAPSLARPRATESTNHLPSSPRPC
jgi:hypothetical protein